MCGMRKKKIHKKRKSLTEPRNLPVPEAFQVCVTHFVSSATYKYCEKLVHPIPVRVTVSDAICYGDRWLFIFYQIKKGKKKYSSILIFLRTENANTSVIRREIRFWSTIVANWPHDLFFKFLLDLFMTTRGCYFYVWFFCI